MGRNGVLVLGAAGGFGFRIIRSLAQNTDLNLVAAGRRRASLGALAASLAPRPIKTLSIDAAQLTAAHLHAFGVQLLIDTVGPFQARDRQLAQTCIANGIHYIDLADDRAFVAGVAELDSRARANNSLIVSGASTVPALSSAVVDELAKDLPSIESVEVGIAPGYLGPRGLATVRSVLSYVGRPISIWRGGQPQLAAGWSEPRIHEYPAPVGRRRLSLVDVPDYDLLPSRYTSLLAVDVRAGLEVPIVHNALSMLGWLVRHGIVRKLSRHAEGLLQLARLFDRLGSDTGGMHVLVKGRNSSGNPIQRRWTLVAERDAGPDIPATAAVLLARRLLGVDVPALTQRGAVPCIGLLTLREFANAWIHLPIRCQRD